MGVFDKLPTVNSCCFCINLKIGCIIIGIIQLLSVLDCVFGGTAMAMDKCKDDTIITIFGYLFYALSVIMLVLSILFLYALFQGKSEFIVWFMWGLLLLIVFQLVYGIIMAVLGSSCSMGYTVAGSALIGFIVSIYFLIVVNSYNNSF